MLKFGVVPPEGSYSLRGADPKGSMMHSILREHLSVGMVEGPRLPIHERTAAKSLEIVDYFPGNRENKHPASHE